METLEQKIENKLKELSDFSDAKVGDKVWSISYGEGAVTLLSNGLVKCSFKSRNNIYSYYLDGTETKYGYPILYKSNPFIEIAKLNNEERWIEVNINGKWEKRKLVAIRGNNAICWGEASTEAEVLNSNYTMTWINWREIQPEVELTLEQIAEKFGIDVNKLKIKK